VEIKLTFREGGAFDFHTIFEQIKERLYQAHTVARENGQRGNVDVDLEQLPAYEPAREVANEDDGPAILSPVPVRPQRNGSIAPASNANPPPPPAAAPDEPPPGYEEAQAQVVGVDDLDRRLREEARKQQ
jgi:WW domain-binding protein 2